MRNDEIRGRILRFFYDFEMTHAGQYISTGHLLQQLADVPTNLINTNLLYLCKSQLLEGVSGGIGTGPTPSEAKITPRGIDVVESPEVANQYPINLQILQVDTVYGQVAQAAQGANITQKQTMTFDNLRRIVQDRQDIDTGEKETIKKILDELDTSAQQGSLTKKLMDESLKALAKYGWLIPPLTQVLKHAFGFH